MKQIPLKIYKNVFNNVYLPYLRNKDRINIFYGGAGSGKSVFVAQREILKHVKEPGHKTLVIRKTGRTHRDSTFDELRSVASSFKISKYFQFKRGDLRIIYLPYNSEFIFVGLDDVEKLKSIRGITDVWIEEATEISNNDFDQIDLRVRGKTAIHKQITMSFNPVDQLHWIKKRFFDIKDDDCSILKTTYKDNKFLDQKYIKRILSLKDKDFIKYQIYALGEWGRLGNLIYTNYEVNDFDITKFKRYYCGQDWGYNDPAAGIKIGFKDDIIHICDEFYVREHDNPELMQVAENIFDKENDEITADNTEPKSIKEWKKKGWKIRAAEKGKDSVKYGIGWIRTHKVIIHPKCQNCINEIQGYTYRENKYGEILEDPVDFNDHLMDAMRYALEKLMKEREFDLKQLHKLPAGL